MKKLSRGKTFLKEAGVLLVAAILVFTSMVTITMAQTTVTLYYHTGYNNNAIGFSGAMIWEGAILLTPLLGSYIGSPLTKVRWYQYDLSATAVVIKIYDVAPGVLPVPGSIDQIRAVAYSVSTTGWQEVDLTPAVITVAGRDLWVSIEFTQTEQGYPFGIDAGPAIDGKGDWIYYGGAWTETQGLGLDYNWCLEAILEVTNEAPVAVGDEYHVCFGSTSTFDVLANDYDHDSTVLLDSFTTPSAQGGIIVRDNGGTPLDASDDKLIYTAPTGFYSPPADTFTYWVSDGDTSVSAIVTVYVCCLEIGDIVVSPSDPDKLEVKITNHHSSENFNGGNPVRLWWNFTIEPDAPCCGCPSYLNLPYDGSHGYYMSSPSPQELNIAHGNSNEGECTVTGNAFFTLNVTAQVTKPGYECFCYKIVTGCRADLQLC
jgi:hypothetical protein